MWCWPSYEVVPRRFRNLLVGPVEGLRNCLKKLKFNDRSIFRYNLSKYRPHKPMDLHSTHTFYDVWPWNLSRLSCWGIFAITPRVTQSLFRRRYFFDDYSPRYPTSISEAPFFRTIGNPWLQFQSKYLNIQSQFSMQDSANLAGLASIRVRYLAGFCLTKVEIFPSSFHGATKIVISFRLNPWFFKPISGSRGL